MYSFGTLVVGTCTLNEFGWRAALILTARLFLCLKVLISVKRHRCISVIPLNTYTFQCSFKEKYGSVEYEQIYKLQASREEISICTVVGREMKSYQSFTNGADVGILKMFFYPAIRTVVPLEECTYKDCFIGNVQVKTFQESI